MNPLEYPNDPLLQEKEKKKLLFWRKKMLNYIGIRDHSGMTESDMNDIICKNYNEKTFTYWCQLHPLGLYYQAGFDYETLITIFSNGCQLEYENLKTLKDALDLRFVEFLKRQLKFPEDIYVILTKECLLYLKDSNCLRTRKSIIEILLRFYQEDSPNRKLYYKNKEKKVEEDYKM